LGLAALGAVLLAGFLPVERRAPEPVLPLALLRNRTFLVAGTVGFLIQVPVYGTMLFVPVFFQLVVQRSAAEAGLLLLPLVGTMVVSTTICGRSITKRGRYRVYPLVGVPVMTLGLVLMRTMDRSSDLLEATAYMAIVGLGLGFTVQVLILAVQNAVDRRDLGVATSTLQLVRMVGGTAGLAAMGAYLNDAFPRALARLHAELPAVEATRLIDDPAMLATFSAIEQGVLRDGLAHALVGTFGVMAALSLLAFVFLAFLEELPLREDHGQRQVS
jgi:hypothetical protein